MEMVLIVAAWCVIAVVVYRTFNKKRTLEVLRVDREVNNIVNLISTDLPDFFDPLGKLEVEQVVMSFEFRLIPLYRKAFSKRGVVLEEAPRHKRISHSHQIRVGLNTIPVSNYVDITEIVVVESAA